MKIVIASGKGGTGKTTVSVNLAHYLATYEKQKVKLFDCDVEAPNDNLFINAKFDEAIKITAPRPTWNRELCTLCGKCTEVCEYNAIAKVKDKLLIFDELCHSCGACFFLCPENALKLKQAPIGKIELATNHKPYAFGHGILKIGESLAPIIIQRLKEEMDDSYINIIDASPGTTCPVVKSMEGMEYCLLVTEPTPFGLNDLKLAASLSCKMKIPTGIVINRSYGKDTIIEEFAQKSNIPILGKIPFNRKYAESYSRGEILVDNFPELQKIFAEIYSGIQEKCKIPIIQENQKLIISDDTNHNEAIVNEVGHVKEMVVISGKGGTGKTTITSSLSELMENKVLADNDVDASNLHILCKPDILRSNLFVGGKTYLIDREKCLKCGFCHDVCHFNAINSAIIDEQTSYTINELSCEGCGFCSHVCPASAISSKEQITGEWFISETAQGPLAHAKLGIGEENSGKLVSFVRDNSMQLAKQYNTNQILSDGPPGTGCPVISSITGVDLALIVTEPTLSGVHDMQRALDLTKHFNIKTLIIINKFDLNENMSSEIEGIAKEYNTKVIGKIPFDKKINDSLIKSESIIKHKQGRAYKAILKMWDELKEQLNEL